MSSDDCKIGSILENDDNQWADFPLPDLIPSTKHEKSIEEAIRRQEFLEQRRQLRFDCIKIKAKNRIASKKQRNVDMWNALTEEEKLTQKLLRKERQEQTEMRLKCAMTSGINVCVELAFDEENSEKERKSLWKQLSLTYGILKRAQVYTQKTTSMKY